MAISAPLLALVLDLAPPPQPPYRPCRDAGATDSDALRISRCDESALDHARNGQPGRAAADRRELLRLAAKLHRERVARSPSDLDEWLRAGGQDYVDLATGECDRHAAELPPAEARSMLAECIDLLTRHLERRTDRSSDEFASLQARRDGLRVALRDLEPAPAGAGPAPAGTGPAPDSPPPPPHTRPPRGLYAGLGVGGGLVVVSAATMVGARLWLQRSADAIDTAGVAEDDRVCDFDKDRPGCDSLTSAGGLFIASAVSFAAATITTAVFAGLLIRHRDRARRYTATPLAAPLRGGLITGLAVEF